MRLPKPKTLQGRALARLLKRATMSSIEFQNETRTYRLGAVIHILRTRYLLPITSTGKTVTTQDHGRKTTYVDYSLDGREKYLDNLQVQNMIKEVDAFEAS